MSVILTFVSYQYKYYMWFIKRQHEHEKLKTKEAHVQQAVEEKKASIDAHQCQKKTLMITEKGDKDRSTKHFQRSALNEIINANV